MVYSVRRQLSLATVQVRGLRFQVYRWEGETARPLLFVHGWGDTGETYQFVVDHLSSRHTIVAFDARGFGRTEWPQDGYWFPDYLADLDSIIDMVSPDEPIDLLGHSMGGNVAMMYAGIRPHRIRRLINLEGFGLQPTSHEQAPARYREWLDELNTGARYATYDDFDQFVNVLSRRNPRTSEERLHFIARSWAQRREDGRIELRSDPKHKRINPVLYQRDQAEACWRAITAPTMFVLGEESELAKRLGAAQLAELFTRSFPAITVRALAGAGHMMHHEQPDKVAELVEEFFR